MKDFKKFINEEWIPTGKTKMGFKKGDKIICVNDVSCSGFLTDGKVYVCLNDEEYNKNDRRYFISVIGNDGNKTDRLSNRFKLVDEPENTNYEEWVQEDYETNQELMNKFHIGDRVRLSGFERDNQYGIINGIITSTNNKGEARVCVYNKDGEYKYITTFHLSSLILDKDKPEESDREEWVQESIDDDDFFTKQEKEYIRTLSKDTEYLQPGDIYLCVNENPYVHGLSEIFNKGNKFIILSNNGKDEDNIYRYDLRIMGTDKVEEGWGIEHFIREGDFVKINDTDEDSNMEEWIEEGLDNKDINVGDKVRIIRKGNYFNKTGKVLDIKTIYNPANFAPILVYVVRFDYNRNTLVYRISDIELYKDDIEDSNMEEWVEESKEYEFKIGDSVVTTFRSEGKFKNSMEGIIIDTYHIREYQPIYCVQFIKNIGEETISLDGTKTHYKNSVWLRGDEIMLVKNDVENSDMEEWIEESNGHKFNIGDRVVCNYDVNQYGRKFDSLTNDTRQVRVKLKGIPGTILDINELGYGIPIEFDKSFQHGHSGRDKGKSGYCYFIKPEYLEFYEDEPEESNMEEWNEKRIIRYENF